MSQLHQERAPGAQEHSRFSIDPPDLRTRTEHSRLRTGGMRANKREALLQRGSIDRFWSIAHDRPNSSVNTICLAPASDGTRLDLAAPSATAGLLDGTPGQVHSFGVFGARECREVTAEH